MVSGTDRKAVTLVQGLRKVLETLAAGAVASEETIPAGRAPWRPDPCSPGP